MKRFFRWYGTKGNHTEDKGAIVAPFLIFSCWPGRCDRIRVTMGRTGSLGKNPDLIFDQSGLSNCSIGSGGRGRGRGGGDGERGDSIHRFFTPLVQHPTHRSNKSAHFLYPMHYFVIKMLMKVDILCFSGHME